MTEEEFKNRGEFLEVYNDFDKWLLCLGFRPAGVSEQCHPMDVYYSYYNEYIDGMYAVEQYILDALKLQLRIIRDKNEHKFIFVGNFFGVFSKLYSLDETKNIILSTVKMLKERKFAELKNINV